MLLALFLNLLIPYDALDTQEGLSKGDGSCTFSDESSNAVKDGAKPSAPTEAPAAAAITPMKA